MNYFESMILVQLTGLSGSGKTTIALRAKEILEDKKIPLEVIDGDVYRRTLCKDLGFSREDRCENIRRLGEVARGFCDREIPALISAINPYESARAALRQNLGARTVWVNCDLSVLIQRDTKGLYRKALLPDGHPEKIPNLTGVNDLYEAPEQADLVLYTDRETPEVSASRLVEFMLETIRRP